MNLWNWDEVPVLDVNSALRSRLMGTSTVLSSFIYWAFAYNMNTYMLLFASWFSSCGQKPWDCNCLIIPHPCSTESAFKKALNPFDFRQYVGGKLYFRLHSSHRNNLHLSHEHDKSPHTRKREIGMNFFLHFLCLTICYNQRRETDVVAKMKWKVCLKSKSKVLLFTMES